MYIPLSYLFNDTTNYKANLSRYFQKNDNCEENKHMSQKTGNTI